MGCFRWMFEVDQRTARWLDSTVGGDGGKGTSRCSLVSATCDVSTPKWLFIGFQLYIFGLPAFICKLVSRAALLLPSSLYHGTDNRPSCPLSSSPPSSSSLVRPSQRRRRRQPSTSSISSLSRTPAHNVCIPGTVWALEANSLGVSLCKGSVRQASSPSSTP